MPILQPETSLFPNHLFSDQYQQASAEAGAKWWAVYTMSRKEKTLMRQLIPLEIGFYCPIIPKTSRSPQGRTRTSFLPLFTNYVFMFANDEQRQLALKTNCISQCLPITDVSQLVSDLQKIETLIQTDVPVTVEAKLEPGTPVRIKSGPFAGMEGTVFQRRNQSRFMVTVNYLQQGASLLLAEWDLEKIY